MPSHVVIVPGLAVRSYAIPAASRLRRTGRRVDLLRAPAWRRAPADLARYGTTLARQLDARERNVDLLVGLSVGSQAAAVAASRTGRIRRLLLVSPTVDPLRRTPVKLAAAQLAERSGARLLDRPGAVHSWPIGDPEGFVELVTELGA